MLIRNFQADTIQDALDLVKKEFGRQAVILKTDIIKENGRRLFSVTAAKDYQGKPVTLTRKGAQPVSASAATVVDNPVLTGASRLESAILDVMLPELLTGEVKRYYLALRANEVESDLAHRICQTLQHTKNPSPENMAQTIDKFVPQLAPFPDKERNIVFIGACGSGKSSLLAKFASELVFNRRRAVALSTLDNFRPGAEEEITTLREILDLAEEGSGGKQKKSEPRYHLIDTGGIVPGDEEAIAELRASLEKISDRFTVLVLSLAASWKNTRRFLAACLPLGVDAIGLTQLDLAQSCGALLNLGAHDYPPIIAISDSRLPTAGVTTFDVRRYLDRLIGGEDA